jgi:hypothetical protein
MNDEKSFQLFREEDEEESKGDSKAARTNTLSIIILLLVVIGAMTVLGYAVTRPDSGERTVTLFVDPNFRKMDPRQFMTDLVTTIREFNDLLESIEEEDAFIVTEVAFAGFVDEMEDIVARASGQNDEPKEEEREELYKMLDELEIQVKRLTGIEQHKRSDRELWKLIDPLYDRFVSAMRMLPMIPPAGMPKDPVEKPVPMPEDSVENPGAEKSEAIPDEPVENPGAILDDPGTC